MDNSDFFTAKTVIMAAMLGMMVGLVLTGIMTTQKTWLLWFTVPFWIMLGIFVWLDIKQQDEKRDNDKEN